MVGKVYENGAVPPMHVIKLYGGFVEGPSNLQDKKKGKVCRKLFEIRKQFAKFAIFWLRDRRMTMKLMVHQLHISRDVILEILYEDLTEREIC
jgi:hypothetical protein